MTDISKTFNVHNNTVDRINTGKIRYDSKLKYPIRDVSLNKQKALNIIDDLLNTNMMIKDIAKKYNMHYQNISDINRGKTYSWLHNYKLPLRPNTRKWKQQK